MKVTEIGKAEKIDLKADLSEFVVHIRGSPAEEAILIKRLIEEEGKTQTEAGRMIGLTQGAVSKRLFILENLIPALFKMLREGKIGPNTAYHLAKLAKEKQEEFAKAGKITAKDVDLAHRAEIVSKGLEGLLAEPLEQGAPPETPEAKGEETMLFFKSPKEGTQVMGDWLEKAKGRRIKEWRFGDSHTVVVWLE
jgi:ParB-like chromosome segregation protein Spo0J